jgi:AAA+ superfamily predicted ATPase
MTATALPATGPTGHDALSGYHVLLRAALDRHVADAVAGPDGTALRRRAAEPVALPSGEVLAGLTLPRPVTALLAAAWWCAADPQLAIGFGRLHDDVARRYPSLAALRVLLAPYGLDVPLALPTDAGPVADGLLRPVTDAESPVRLTETAALLFDGWRPPVIAPTAAPPRLRNAVEQATALVRAGHRVAVRCADAEDGTVLAAAVAARLGRALETDAAPERPAAETALLAQLGLVLPVGETEAVPTRLRLTAPGAPVSPGWQVLDVAAIDADGVRRAWRQALSACGLDTSEADQLAARMRLPERSVEALRRDAQQAAHAQQRHVTVADLHQAVRRHPHHRLDGMARLLPPSLTLDDLVLAESTRTGLRDLLAHARHSSAVTAQWPGIRGRAVVALLHGPSGTGKTAATEAIARELERDLWIVDLAQVVSKWLGETSRNLDKLLTEAARAGVVLLFDEAEGLFGRRAEVTDARDRYANLEIDHLLQRIELHEGLVVLTSNRPAALDEGFQRRLRLSVRFELPDHAARRRIWAALLPEDRLAPDADLDHIAAAELSGAGVRAAALAAQVFAAADGTPVGAAHLDRGVQRELEKGGRNWTAQHGRAERR